MRALSSIVSAVVLSTLFLTSALPAAEPARAERPMFKGVELYSWRERSGAWRFALLPGTNRNKSAREILAAEDPAESVDVLLTRLSRLARGETVIWLTPDDARFSMPPQDIRVRIAAAADTAGIRLTMPAGARNP